MKQMKLARVALLEDLARSGWLYWYLVEAGAKIGKASSLVARFGNYGTISPHGFPAIVIEVPNQNDGEKFLHCLLEQKYGLQRIQRPSTEKESEVFVERNMGTVEFVALLIDAMQVTAKELLEGEIHFLRTKEEIEKDAQIIWGTKK